MFRFSWPMFLAFLKRESKWYAAQFDRDMLLHRTPLAAAVLAAVLLFLGAAGFGTGLLEVK